jgi:hypothetical protein
VAEFGSMAGSGMLSIMDVNFDVLYAFSLKKGSLWTSEWAPRDERLSLGVTSCSLLIDTSTCKVTRQYTQKSDVFSQQWDSNVGVSWLL